MPRPRPPASRSARLFQDASVPARLMVDDLLAKHFLVVGSTGSGKSSARHLHPAAAAVTSIATPMCVILDIHNEYSAAFGGLVEPINLDNFSLPFWMLDFTEMWRRWSAATRITTPKWKSWPTAVVHAKKRYSESATSRAGALRKSPKATWSSRSTRPRRSACRTSSPGIDEQLGRLERTQFTAALSPPEGAHRNPGHRPALQLHVRQPVGAGHDGRCAGAAVPRARRGPPDHR